MGQGRGAGDQEPRLDGSEQGSAPQGTPTQVRLKPWVGLGLFTRAWLTATATATADRGWFRLRPRRPWVEG